jgi:hypothetical protein
VVRYDGDQLPVWDDATSRYLDPATGELLPTWDQALDNIGPQDQPLHVVRFGPRLDAQGVLAGSNDAGRCVRYLTKYLTKQIAGCHTAGLRPRSRGRAETVTMSAPIACRIRYSSVRSSARKTRLLSPTFPWQRCLVWCLVISR